MKPTQQQLSVLQDILRKQITYRETYEEVYDHVLTALTQYDDNIPLMQTVNNILFKDFGGFAGLRLMERKRRWLIARQMINKQFWYFSKHFKFPLLPLILLIFCFFFYFADKIKLNIVGWFILVAMAIIPVFIRGIRYFKTGYFSNDTKKSINDFPFKIIGIIPFYITFWIIIVEVKNWKELTISTPVPIDPLIFSLLSTLYIIYTISYFMLNQDEYKKLQVK